MMGTAVTRDVSDLLCPEEEKPVHVSGDAYAVRIDGFCGLDRQYCSRTYLPDERFDLSSCRRYVRYMETEGKRKRG